jgi:hypothetical protein
MGEDGGVFQNAKAVEFDILANNGVVHKIDNCLNPFTVDPHSKGPLSNFVVENDELTVLTTAVLHPVDTLNSDDPFHFVCPSTIVPLSSSFRNLGSLDDEFIPHQVNLCSTMSWLVNCLH